MIRLFLLSSVIRILIICDVSLPPSLSLLISPSPSVIWTCENMAHKASSQTSKPFGQLFFPKYGTVRSLYMIF